MGFGLGIGQGEENIEALLGTEPAIVGLVSLLGLPVGSVDGYNLCHGKNILPSQPRGDVKSGKRTGQLGDRPIMMTT